MWLSLPSNFKFQTILCDFLVFQYLIWGALVLVVASSMFSWFSFFFFSSLQMNVVCNPSSFAKGSKTIYTFIPYKQINLCSIRFLFSFLYAVVWDPSCVQSQLRDYMQSATFGLFDQDQTIKISSSVFRFKKKIKICIELWTVRSLIIQSKYGWLHVVIARTIQIRWCDVVARFAYFSNHAFNWKPENSFVGSGERHLII